MEESKRPKASTLTQQKMRSFQPIHTLQSTLLLFTTSGLVFLFFVITLPYHDHCHLQPECEIPFELEYTLKPPVLIYYELGNFYQNHREYVRSRDNKQLFGVPIDPGNATYTCNPVITMGDVGKNSSIGGDYLPSETVANPCGLVAKSLFNGNSHIDTFTLFDSNRSNLYLNETDIAWRSDTKYIFNHPENYTQIQWVDVENEHFQVWMRTALLPKFRKLWGHFDGLPLKKGNYTIKVRNNYDVSSWNGTKSVVLATTTPFGGNTQFFGYFLLAGAAACGVAILAFLLKSTLSKIPEIDDLMDLKWD